MVKLHKNLISINSKLYKNISINRLILLAIYLLDSNKKSYTFEKLIKQCFVLFPKKFSFENNTKWPDSRKLDRQLRNLREKGLIIGGSKGLISLTIKGEKLSKDTLEIFRQKTLGFR